MQLERNTMSIKGNRSKETEEIINVNDGLTNAYDQIYKFARTKVYENSTHYRTQNIITSILCFVLLLCVPWVSFMNVAFRVSLSVVLLGAMIAFSYYYLKASKPVTFKTEEIAFTLGQHFSNIDQLNATFLECLIQKAQNSKEKGASSSSTMRSIVLAVFMAVFGVAINEIKGFFVSSEIPLVDAVLRWILYLLIVLAIGLVIALIGGLISDAVSERFPDFSNLVNQMIIDYCVEKLSQSSLERDAGLTTQKLNKNNSVRVRIKKMKISSKLLGINT
jgi:hypothetical protein